MKKIFFALSILATAGCQSSVIMSTAPETLSGDVALRPSMTYSLPKSLLKVQGGLCLGEADVAKCNPSSELAAYHILITSEIVADPTAKITSRIEKSDWSNDKQILKVNPEGLLTTASTDAADQTQAVIVSLAQALAIGGVKLPGASLMSLDKNTYLQEFTQTRSGYEPSKHKLGAFVKYCDGFDAGCAITIPVEGRLAKEETQISVALAPAGTREGQSFTNKYPCPGYVSDSTISCNEVSTTTTYTQDKKVYVETRTTQSLYHVPPTNGLASTLHIATNSSCGADSISSAERLGAAEIPGLIYRRAGSHLAVLSTNESRVELATARVNLVDRCAYSVVPIRRGYTQAETSLTFASGMLTELDGKYQSPIANAAATPVVVGKGVLTALTEILTARVNVTTQENSLIDTETAQISAIIKRIEEQKKLDEALEDEALEEATP